MSRKRVLLLTLFLLAVGLFALVLHQLQLGREQEQRELASASTARTVSASMVKSFANAIKSGSRRDEIDSYLQSRQIGFFQRSEPGQPIFEDLIRLGRRPSGVWYCGPAEYGVEIFFHPANSVAEPEVESPADIFWKIESYERADNCL